MHNGTLIEELIGTVERTERGVRADELLAVQLQLAEIDERRRLKAELYQEET